MSRQEVLARIREALTVPTAGHPDRTPVVRPPSEAPRWAADFDGMWTQFEARSAALKTEVHRVADAGACTALLRTMAASDGWGRAASHRAELTTDIVEGLDLPVLWVDDGIPAKELETCPVGISTCEALVAQSGSAWVSPGRGGGRALSSLPPHHVILARRSDLVADLPAAFVRLRERFPEGWPSFLSLITGPSRTGDIERILVLGAHGPRRLTIVLINEGEPT